MGYITLAEIAAASVPTPSAGSDNVYFDSADGLWKKKNSSGTVTVYATNDSVYRTVTQASAFATASALTAAVYFPTHAGAVAVTGTSAASAAQGLFYSRTADYSQTTLATKYRIAAQLHVNATAPTITFVMGLHPVTAVAGAAGQLTYTVGAAIAGSTVTYTTPGASSQNGSGATNTTGLSGDFAIPADGYYVPAVVPSGAGAANSVVGLTWQLQMRST
jgi:hypothetical protein